MRFRFLLSAPQGDIELSREDLAQPFLIRPAEKHPFLTLKDYFGALEKLILSHNKNIIHGALTKLNMPGRSDLGDISEVLICSEKHGAFYHIASITLIGLAQAVKFAVTTALSESAIACLEEEFFIMQRLAGLNPDFLPQLLHREIITWPKGPETQEFLMVLGEWLDGYHEWHLHADAESKKHHIQLWDYDNGFRILTETESYEVLRQAAYILTCYYDQDSFRQIYPWHHGAGDFVVKAERGAVSVKLITARQYEPLVYFETHEESDRLISGIHFLLNLSLRVRLDRFDGVDESAWFDDFAVHAAVAGFFAGLAAAGAEGRFTIGPLPELLEILQSFDVQEILDMYDSLLAVYADEDQDDYQLILARLPEHAEQLHAALQEFYL